MTLCRVVPPGLVLAVHQEPAGPWGRQRRVVDQRASRTALDTALHCYGNHSAPAFSLSHTEGIGAALIGPETLAFGVDLVRMSRVSEREAKAITAEAEWASMGGQVPPALVWGLKESAAKATGDPARFFGTVLRIVPGARGHWEVIGESECPGRRFSTRWMRLGEYLLVWVWAAEDSPGDPARLPPYRRPQP